MLALIPARGGSKGLPGKNIRSLAGLPLIAWTIRAAQAARCVSRIVVTTDDPTIAAVAREHGAEVPCLRPAELAKDDSPAWAAYLHMAEVLELAGTLVPEFVILQPTSPLRMAADIDNAITTFHERNALAVMSVSASQHPPSWLRYVDPAGVLRPYLDGDQVNAHRQDCPLTYMPNGAVVVLNRVFLQTTRSYLSDRTYAYEMPISRAVDIDTMDDFLYAEWLMTRNR